MRLNNFKYALIITVALGASDAFSAVGFTDIDADATAHAITGSATFGMDTYTTGAYTGALTSAVANTDANAYLATTLPCSMTTNFGTAAAPVLLSVMNTGDLTLNANNFYKPVTGLNGSLDMGSLRVYAPSRIRIVTAVPVFNNGAYMEYLSDGTLDFVTTALDLAGDIMIAAGKTLYINVDTGKTATISGKIKGGGRIVKKGGGDLFLTNALNDYAGGETAEAGLLYLPTVVLTHDNTPAITISDRIVKSFTVPNGSNYKLKNLISGSGHFRKLGEGVIDVQGNNTGFTGKVILGNGTDRAGTVIVSHANALGVDTIETDFVVSAASVPTLKFSTSAKIKRAVSLASNLIIDVGSTTSSKGVVTPSLATFDGIISETGGARSITKTGAGQFVPTRLNTFSGGLALNGGVFQFGNAGAAGTSAITTTVGTAIITPTGEATVANTIAFGVGGYTNILSLLKTNKTIFTGAWSGLGGPKKMGDGAISLTVANSYSYGTEFAGGVVWVGHVDALSSVADAGVRVSAATMIKPISTGLALTAHDYDLAADLIAESAFAAFTIQGNFRNGPGKFIPQGGGVITQTPANGSANNMLGDIVPDANTTYVQGNAGSVTSGKIIGKKDSVFRTNATTGPRLVATTDSRFIMTF